MASILNGLRFVKTIHKPDDEKTRRFSQQQEAARKDVERVFDVLQSRWAIARHPARTWSKETMWEVMIACAIMHNMIVEDGPDERVFDQGWEFQGGGGLIHPALGPPTFQQYLHMHHEIRDKANHKLLLKDLLEHMWIHWGNQ